jgi:hypothetical protein
LSIRQRQRRCGSTAAQLRFTAGRTTAPKALYLIGNVGVSFLQHRACSIAPIEILYVRGLR